MQASPTSRRASARRHLSRASRMSGPPHNVTGDTLCVRVERFASHIVTQYGQIAIVSSTNASAPYKARLDGYAANIAIPIVGLAASRNPSDGVNAAAVSSGDH